MNLAGVAPLRAFGFSAVALATTGALGGCGIAELIARSPTSEANVVVKRIADGNVGALSRELDGEGKSRVGAQRIVDAFDGWTIDRGSISHLRQLDDNWYGFDFKATQRRTGHVKTIRANLAPQGETGEPPFKLTDIWIELRGKHHTKSIL